MKFYTSQINNVIAKITNNEIKSILLHGPNSGYGNVIINEISKKLDLIITTISFKELSPTKLALMANNANFFGKKELIKITDTTSGINQEMKALLTANNFLHFVCFTATDSLPASGIRKFYEEQNHLGSIGCYYDNEQTIARFITQQCIKLDKTIEKEALFYLKSHLKGDHQIIKNELNKLFAYSHDQNLITKQDVINSLSLDILANGDEMCIYFAKADAAKFVKEVEKLKQQNINEVLMIRALTRYYTALYFTSLRVKDGINLDRAMKLLSPPIFYQYINDFKQILQQSSDKKLLEVIERLQQCEVSYKNHPATFDFFTQLYLPVHENSVG